MKKTLLAIALLAASSAFAQSTINAQSSSTSNVSGSNSALNSTVSGQASNQGNNQAITVEAAQPLEKYTVRSAPAIAAPSLTTTLTDTCMGSTSVGGSAVAVGLTVGSTWTDEECVNRLNARELRAMGDNEAAREVLCSNPTVRAAYKRSGKPCAADKAQPVALREVSACAAYSGNDPLVKARVCGK